MGKAYRISTARDRLRKNQIEIKDLQAINRLRNTPRPVATTAFSGVSAAGDVGGIGNFLPLSGGVVSGQFGLNPPVDFRIEVDSNNTIDIGESDSNSQYSSNIQLDSLQPNSSVLDIIKGAARDGVMLFIRTFAPTVPYTIRQGNLANGGNIQTLDGNDFVLGDLQIIGLLFDESLKIEANVGGSWRVYTLGTSGGGGGISFPIDFPEDDRGTVGASTQDILFTDSDRHSVKMIISGDVDLSFSSPPTNKTAYTNIIIVQDGTGGHVVTLPINTVNKEIVEEGILLDPDTETGIVVKFAFGIFYAFLETGNIVTGGSSFSGDLSDLVININKDWLGQGISNFGPLTGITATQYVDTGAVVRGTIFGDTGNAALGISLVTGGKLQISDIITPILEIDDATGLTILGSHVINMENNIINSISELQLSNGNPHTPSNENTIAFDNIDDALKYSVALTTDSHRFYADTDLLASFSRIGINAGLLSVQVVTSTVLQATEALLLSTFTNSTPSNGEIWRDLSTGLFQFQQNGVTEELGGGGEFFGPWTANHDAGNFALNDVSSIQISDSVGGVHGLLQGLVTPEVRLTLTTGEKFSIFDNITNILEIDDTIGLKMLGSHVINMGNNVINSISELQLDNSNVFSPTTQNVIGFDGFTKALKYNTALTIDIHSFHAAGELLAGISRIDVNSGQLSVNAVVAEILQANDKVAIQNGFEIKNTDSTTTEFIIPTDEVLKFIDDSIEVGKYDSDTGNWVFNPTNDVQLSPVVDIDLLAGNNIVVNPTGEMDVFCDIDLQAGNTIDYADTASVPIGSASDAFVIKINGVTKIVKAYTP